MKLRRLLIAALILVGVGATPISGAHAAPLPASWCGQDEASIDRPDAVFGMQIHVIYAYPADGHDRFHEFAPRIARDLAGVDEWWRGQDPTRTPRFDLAAFPGCDSEFGALDISAVHLDQDASAYVDDPETAAAALLARFAGVNIFRKHYLLYYDGPVHGPACGISNREGSTPTLGQEALSIVFLQPAARCDVASFGSGDGGTALVAAHEIVHGLDDRQSQTQHPNRCPDDPGHVCDDRDLMTPSVQAQLSRAVLDVGNDDYYGHSSPWFDVQDSPYLVHIGLEETVAASVVGSGTIKAETGNVVCPEACRWPYDRGSAVRFIAQPMSGQRLVRWSGACSGSAPKCDVTINGPTDVGAVFGPLALVDIVVRGHGSIASYGERPCDQKCVIGVAPRERLALVARPDHGMRLLGWRGACSGTKPRCLIKARAGGETSKVNVTFGRK